MWSHIILLVGVVLAGLYAGIPAVYTVLLLCALEISVSFDNAVVNAKVLNTMTPVWQDRFITYGIPIAVFGMRFLFPLAIVAVAADISMLDTLTMAINTPEQYHHALEGNKLDIFAFGGAFLLMVFLSFFFDEDREEKWLNLLEGNRVTKKLSTVANIELVIATAVGLALISYTQSVSVAMAFFGSILLFEVINSLDDLLSTDGVRSGVIGFLYLEVLDASFSFDGVIGAFALTTDIFIIMIGLGVGAMYVRSLTIYLVKKGTLAEYRFLEHGAHYAIGALSIIMFIKMFMEVNEIVVGSIGIGFILIALVHSLILNRTEAKVEDTLKDRNPFDDDFEEHH